VVVVVGAVVVEVVVDSVLVVLVVGSVVVLAVVVGMLVVELVSLPSPLSLAITTTATISPTMIARSAATR
jgi:hypothetical protein